MNNTGFSTTNYGDFVEKTAFQQQIKTAAKNACLEHWKDVYPHCLRKSYEDVLRSLRIDGTRMDVKTQEFLMGHILPSAQDAYYGSGTYVYGSGVQFDSRLVEKLREEYSLLDFGGLESQVKQIVAQNGKRYAELMWEVQKLKEENELLKSGNKKVSVEDMEQVLSSVEGADLLRRLVSRLKQY